MRLFSASETILHKILTKTAYILNRRRNKFGMGFQTAKNNGNCRFDFETHRLRN